MMTTELAIGEQLRTVTVDAVERMKRELAIGETDALDPARLASVGRRLGTDLVVTGSYLAIGEKIRLDVRLMDIGTGEALVSVSESDRATELIDLVARAGASLRRNLRADEVSAEQQGDLRASVPATAEAARLYATGRARLRAFDAMAARAAFEQVTAQEPEFALGHAGLADALTLLGMGEAAVAASERALALMQPLRREERLGIELRHHVAKGAWDPAIAVARSLHELFPDDVDHGLELTAVQMSAGRMKEALATIAVMRRLPPPLGDDPRLDLAEAEAYSQLGDAALLERAATRALHNAELLGATTIALRARLLLAWRLFLLSEYERCVQQLEQLRGVAVTLGEPALMIELLHTLMSANAQLDELGAAVALGEEAVREATRLGNHELTADLQGNLAALLFRLGRLEDAGRAQARTTLASPSNQINGQVLRGQIAAARGEIAEAGVAYEASLQRLRALDDERMIAWVQALRGEVAIEADRLDEAEGLVRESLAARERLGLAMFVAECKLLLARIALARGRHEEAVVTATAAVEGYAATRSRSEEAEARAWLVQALLAGGQAVDVPLTRAQALAARTQTPQTRLRVALVAALVAGSRGDQGEARRALAGVVEEATELGFGVIALEARQAAARVEIAAGRASEGRDALAAVVADAERLGLRRIAREARAP
jgi:tetratricopeptide (TPR) repeat protein